MIRFVRVLTPSVRLLLQGRVSPAFTAARSSSRPLQKLHKCGRSTLRTAVIPVGELVVVALGGVQGRGEFAGESRERGHLGAGRGEEVEQFGVHGPQMFEVGEQEPGEVARGCHGTFAFGAALVLRWRTSRLALPV